MPLPECPSSVDSRFSRDTGLVRKSESARPASGFTLLEILVVVVIIGALIAMVAPAVQSGMERSKSAKCVSNIRQLGSGIHLMVAEYGHYPPTQDYVTLPGGALSHTIKSWPIYVRDNPCLGCPSAKYHGPHPLTPQRMISAYSANPRVCGRVVDSAQYVRPANISRPSQVILLTDGAQWDQPNNPRSYHYSATPGLPAGKEADAEKPLTTKQIPAGGSWDPNLSLIPLRHNGRANILFIDGHVKSIGDISELKEKNLHWNY